MVDLEGIEPSSRNPSDERLRELLLHTAIVNETSISTDLRNLTAMCTISEDGVEPPSVLRTRPYQRHVYNRDSRPHPHTVFCCKDCVYQFHHSCSLKIYKTTGSINFRGITLTAG